MHASPNIRTADHWTSRIAAALLVAAYFFPAATFAACPKTVTFTFNPGCTNNIVWQNPGNGELDVWTMNSNIVSSSAVVAARPLAPWTLQGMGYFYGGAPAGMLWRNTATGELDMWRVNGGSITGNVLSSQPSSDWSFLGLGDFN